MDRTILTCLNSLKELTVTDGQTLIIEKDKLQYDKTAMILTYHAYSKPITPSNKVETLIFLT